MICGKEVKEKRYAEYRSMGGFAIEHQEPGSVGCFIPDVAPASYFNRYRFKEEAPSGLVRDEAGGRGIQFVEKGKKR